MDKTVSKVLARTNKYNIKLKANKLQFYQNKVKYLGLLFSKNGIKPDDYHTAAIIIIIENNNNNRELKIPNNKKELQ